jgi:hypothetical protein
MTLIIWVVRVLLIALILRFVLQGIARMITPARQVKRPRRPQERIGGSLVRDPQCGTYLPEDRAFTVRQANQALHFCSTACRDAWMAAHRT